VVLNGDPEHEAALWGGLLAAAAVRRGLGGVVADGPVRDLPETIETKLPLFGTGSIPPGQAGILTLGAINEPLASPYTKSPGCTTMHPGDFVYGDANGVVVIPAGLEAEVLREAVAVEARDQEATKRILAGASLQETMKALGRG
jgi:4-hydroxy-4-methyl-2-oxoglutarate aldolase